MRYVYVLLLIPLLLVHGCGSENEAAFDELVERSHIGVSCGSEVKHHTLNGSLLIDQYFAKNCERVGLAIWLKRPARRLRASLAGQWFTMHAAPSGSAGIVPASPGPNVYFVGFLQPAGFSVGRLRVGHDTALRLAVQDPDGRELTASSPVRCCGGWG